jgi:hypothetical protein
MKNLLSTLALIALLAAAWTGTVEAQTSTIDYLGFSWEVGGFPASNPGDELQFTGVATSIDPLFGVDLGTVEVTFHAYGLISTGEFVDGFGNTVIGYTGGTLDIYSDAAENADWGINPPNASSPATFDDGLLLFRGAFSDFTLILTPSGAGAYEGNLDGVAGDILSGGCTGCAFTWGGAFTADIGAQIPDGYDIQMDGVFELDNAVSTERTGWGALKARFSN